ncbi:MAG: sensor histidine kinase [Acetanaerobacterium sp.]
MDTNKLLNDAISLYSQLDIPTIILNADFELEWLSECAGRVYPQLKLKNGFMSQLTPQRLCAAQELLAQNKSYSFCSNYMSNTRFNCTLIPLMHNDVMRYVLVQLSQAPEHPSCDDDEDVTRIISTFSKHVREPLFYIFSALSTVGHRFETAEDYASLEYVKTIHKNSYAILRTIAHLSDYMKDVNGIPSHNPKPTPFSMYVRDLYTAVEAVTRGTGVPVFLDMVDANDSGLVNLDESRLSEAILNILLNSFLYTREENRITISLHYIGSSAVLTIADTGTGIPPEYLGKVFNAHFSYDMGNAPLRRVGLGLTLARNTIMRHGGTIAIDSKENMGTSITIRLPLVETDGVVELFQSPSTLNLRNRFSPIFVELAEISSPPIL